MESLSMGWRSRQSVSVNEYRYCAVISDLIEENERLRRELDEARKAFAKVKVERSVLFNQCGILRLENRRLENELSMREMQDDVR